MKVKNRKFITGTACLEMLGGFPLTVLINLGTGKPCVDLLSPLDKADLLAGLRRPKSDCILCFQSPETAQRFVQEVIIVSGAPAHGYRIKALTFPKWVEALKRGAREGLTYVVVPLFGEPGADTFSKVSFRIDDALRMPRLDIFDIGGEG